MTFLQLYDNQFTDFPDISSLSVMSVLQMQNNNFTFEDIEPYMDVASTTFTYAPQDSVGSILDTMLVEGSSFTLSASVGGSANQYQWFLDEILISGAEDSAYIINSFAASDTGSYTCEITNTIVTGLTLTSRPIKLSLDVGTDINSEQVGLPKDYFLYANYPNPFNPTTTIKYDLPKAGKVNLSLYNLKGQKVMEMVNENRSAGSYNYTLNATSLASGIYFYRINAGGFTATRRLLLIK